nr:hypothetical protein [uncultured Methanoregula sp.]
MEAFHEHGRLLALIPAIVLWGCFGGICLAGVNFFLQAMWTPIFTFNYALSPPYQIQMIITYALILWILGMMAADLFRIGGETGRWDPVLTGLLSGISSALVYVPIIAYQDLLSRPLTVYYTHDLFLMRSFLDRLFHPWLITLAGFILVSGILQTIGVWYQRSRQEPGSDRHDSRKSAIATAIHRQRFLLLALLAALVIPPGLAYIGMGTGFIDKSPSCCPIINDSVNVSRTGPFSIRIVMEPDPDTVQRTSDKVPSIKIFIDEMDVSNQSIITGSGYDDTIDPPEGLRYHEGASVTLQGKGVSGNETVPAHLVIIVTYPDHGGRAVICDRDI